MRRPEIAWRRQSMFKEKRIYMQTRHELAETARRAARLIEQRGLHKGDYIDIGTGAVCLQGALVLALGARDLRYNFLFTMQHDNFRSIDRACASLLRREGHDLKTYGDDGNYNLPSWNDRPEITAEDVVLLLKKEAEELETA